jgi:hypothetical protein
VRLLDGDQHQYQTAKHIKHIKQPQDFHGIEIEILSTYPTYPLEPLFGHHWQTGTSSWNIWQKQGEEME